MARAESSHDGSYFDQLVEDEGDFNPFTERGWQTLARRFTAVGAADSGMRVLDIGCGTGQSRQVYARHTATYVGLDLSLGALRRAAARHPQSAWLQADALRLPFSDGAFDVVAFSSVLHHVPNMDLALSEAARVVVPGGLVFAFDPNLLHPAMLLFRHPRSPLYTADGVSPHECPLQPVVLRRAFERAGLVGLGQRCQSHIPYRAVAPRLLNAVLPFYNLADLAWEYCGAARWFGTFVLTWGRTRPLRR